MITNKKILLVGNTAWSMLNFRIDVARALRESGCEVTIAAPEDHTTPLIKAEGFGFITIPMDNKGVSPKNDLNLLANFYKVYKSHKPDLIIHYTIKPNIYGVLAARACSIPSIAFVTGLGSMFIKRTYITRMIEQLYKFSFRFAKKVWFLNQDDYAYFTDKKLVSPFKAEILNGEGVDTEKYHVKDADMNGAGDFTFLYLGRILKDKGIIELIVAARQVKSKYPQARIQLLGYIDALNPSAITQGQVDEWVSEGIIEYLGHTNDVIPFIAKVQCVVLPSYREGISMTLLEAASLQRPIIATNVTGCKEIVQHGVTGFLCNPADAEDLATQMLKMLELTQNQLSQMGAASRDKIVAEFDISAIIEKYKSTISELA